MHDVHEYAEQIRELVEVRQIDEAFDYAARVARATVAEFVAAPAPIDDGVPPAIEIAVEFFVPPASVEQFETELDRALMRRSLEYSAVRRTDRIRPVRLRALPAGTFHQWRVAFRVSPATQHAERWSADRATLDTVLTQARQGWREPIAMG